MNMDRNTVSVPMKGGISAEAARALATDEQGAHGCDQGRLMPWV
jgi:hypothetical protein